jgi:L-2-hydroxyglutarate oxidase LhgO
MPVMNECDVAIAGAGIIGLSIAKGLLELDSSLRISVFEKEESLAQHASGRNSGVIHAGFYYSPNSLKARFCLEGRDELLHLISRHAIPLRKVGKVVVTQNPDEVARLETLYNRGIENGVSLEILEQSEINKYEPLAKSFGPFLWSPSTSISDPAAVLNALALEVRELGAKIIFGSQLTFENTIKNNGVDIGSRYFINAAGTYADRIAHQFGLVPNLTTMPFLGSYQQTEEKFLPIKRLIYPVPHPINPFLGVHLTMTLDGHVKVGPTAVPIIGREQYSLKSKVSGKDFGDFIRNSIAMIKGTKHDLFAIARYELPKLYKQNLLDEATHLVPKVRDVKNWNARKPGIRGQLIDTTNGELIQDFIIEHGPASTHVLNAVSPGWTAGLSFGKYIARQVIEKI